MSGCRGFDAVPDVHTQRKFRLSYLYTYTLGSGTCKQDGWKYWKAVYSCTILHTQKGTGTRSSLWLGLLTVCRGIRTKGRVVRVRVNTEYWILLSGYCGYWTLLLFFREPTALSRSRCCSEVGSLAYLCLTTATGCRRSQVFAFLASDVSRCVSHCSSPLSPDVGYVACTHSS